MTLTSECCTSPGAMCSHDCAALHRPATSLALSAGITAICVPLHEDDQRNDNAEPERPSPSVHCDTLATLR